MTTIDLEARQGPEQDDFDRAADSIETVTFYPSLLADPVGAALRAIVPLPLAIETHPFLGIHFEWCIPPAIPPVPVPTVALLMGLATPSVIGIAFDLAMFAAGASPVPVTGVYVGIFKALKAGLQPTGLHLPASPPGVPLVLPGEPEFMMGSSSVDVASRHALRFLESGFGCNHPSPSPEPSVPLPNTKLIGPIQYTFPVVAGGQSVLDVQAVGDRVLEELISELVNWLASAVPSPSGEVGEFLMDFGRSLAAGLISDLTEDGTMTLSSFRDDVLDAIESAISGTGDREMEAQHRRQLQSTGWQAQETAPALR